MIKKFIFFLLIINLINSYCSAQNFMFSYGATVSIFQDEGTLKYGTFFLRRTISERDNSSLSIGTPFSLGVGGVDEGGVFFVADVPVTADFNFGCKSTPETESGFGGFIGAGFGYTYLAYTESYYGGPVKQIGPLVHAGIRFNYSKNSSSALEIGFFYKRGINVDKLQSAGIRILMAH
jgi:hypothetical protein